MIELSPIILFVYNRPSHTRRTLEALQSNDLANQSRLFIFSDGPKITGDAEKDERCSRNIKLVREIVSTVSGFRSVEVIERQENMGLANSVIAGVSEIMNRYGQAIVLEDDMLSSRNFLTFMNACLSRYHDDRQIFCLSGYAFPIPFPSNFNDPVYLFQRTSSWGWASWKDRWDLADWSVDDYDSFIKSRSAKAKFNLGGNDLTPMLDLQMRGKIDSWSIRFDYACSKQNAYCLYPRHSKILNIGTDGSGTHFTSTTNQFNVDLDTDLNERFLPTLVKVQPQVIKICRQYFDLSFNGNQTLTLRSLNVLKRFLRGLS